MNDPFLPEEVWRVALGPPPLKEYLAPYEPWWWTAEDEGPHDAVYLHREIDAQIRARGGDINAAKQVREELRRDLQTARRKAIGVQAETGARLVVPASAWEATGEAPARLWHVAEYCDPAAPDVPYRVYLLRPEARPAWWCSDKQSLKSWCAPDGAADQEAHRRLNERHRTISEKAICLELSYMRREAGCRSGTPGSIEQARRALR